MILLALHDRQMKHQVCIAVELQLNKAYTSDTEAPFLDLHRSISNGLVFPQNS